MRKSIDENLSFEKRRHVSPRVTRIIPLAIPIQSASSILCSFSFSCIYTQLSPSQPYAPPQNQTQYCLLFFFKVINIFVGEMAGLMDKAKDFVADKVANMKKPEATVKNVDLKEVTCQCITYKADVNVSNPYSTPIPICEISYTFKSADRVIAEGSIPDPGSLKANTDTMLDVGVKVPHSVLVSLMRDIGADWDIDYELNIILTVDLPVIGNLNIPVNSKGEIKLPTLSSLMGVGGSVATATA